jgi:hypothetical protein
MDLRRFENKVQRKILNLRGRKWQEAGEDCIVRSFVSCMHQEMLLGR